MGSVEHRRKAWPAFAVRWLLTATVLTVGLAVPIAARSAEPADRALSDGSVSTSASVHDATVGPPDVLPPDGRWSVTLLTGDVVDVQTDADGRVAAHAREPRTPYRTIRKPDGELYVVPLAVTPLLQQVLDLELFNVSGLVRQGYDDASVDVVPLIVQRQPGVDVQATFPAATGELPLPSIDAVATEVAKGDTQAAGQLLAQLGADMGPHADSVGGITRVWLDRQVTTRSASGSVQTPAPSDPNLAQIGADRAWAAGFTGEGVTVAVLDTGIDSQHPALTGRVVAEQNFSDSEDTVDRVGHGTHVASIAAGGSAPEGAHSGVAPGADLMNVKVLDDFGFGSLSGVIAGMEWAAAQADVVNMSLGATTSASDDPLSLAVDQLTEQHGALFVVAAGNAGPVSTTIDTPGIADRALTVGAVDAEDVIADFSGRGPVVDSFELKPELVAPGVDIVAARARGTTVGEPVDELYTVLSGTSMATPHAAGAAAILAQEHPDWTPEQLKNGLVGSSDPVDGDGYDTGAGRIDIGDSVDTTLRAEHDVLEMPLAQPRTEPHTETITWTNTHDEPQTLSLDAELENRRGEPVDNVSIEPAQLTIAPGTTGTATLRVDGPNLDNGLYSGTVTADPAGGGDQDDTRTPIAVHATPEQVELTIDATPPRGVTGVPALATVAITNLDDFAEFNQLRFFVDTTTVQVPAGRYSVLGDVSTTSPYFDVDADQEVVASVGDPDVPITQDVTVRLDGAAAIPFEPTVEGVETAPPMWSSAAVVTIPRSGTAGFGLVHEIGGRYPMPPLQLTPMEADPEVFAATQMFRLQAPHLTARVGDDPIEATPPHASPLPDEGQSTLTAVDAGDGSDLSGTRGQLAVVALPDDTAERAAVTERAVQAGTALVAFVDPGRTYLTLDAAWPDLWADIPTIAVPGPSATRLQVAATAGEQVTTTVVASPYVYDIVTPDANGVDPEPVIDRAEQRELATLLERFHRDPDGQGSTGERRRYRWNLMNVDTEGPLPERRTAHVTPDVVWMSVVISYPEGRQPVVDGDIAVSIDPERSYAPGSRTTLNWLRRPQWPAPVGGDRSASRCQPEPVRRTADALRVSLTPFQDGRDRFGCAEPDTSALTLERDGTVIGQADGYEADMPLPADPGTYRLSYQQTGRGPYPHRSSTTWTFRSQAPEDPMAEELIPLVVVDYELPLDTLNRPTGDTATFVVHHMTGTEGAPIDRLRVWTSTDGGATWRRASVARRDDGRFRVGLPHVDTGTAVSLRVDARDAAGNRIEQTLHDAYRG